MRIEPIGDKIVIKRLSAEEKTAGGIVLPESSQNKPHEGRVLSVGQGTLNSEGKSVAPQVSEGDRVIFSSYGGTEVEIDGTQLLILTESDILAILE